MSQIENLEEEKKKRKEETTSLAAQLAEKTKECECLFVDNDFLVERVIEVSKSVCRVLQVL